MVPMFGLEIVIVIVVEVTAERPGSEEVISTEILSLVLTDVVEYVAAVAPLIANPFFCH